MFEMDLDHIDSMWRQLMPPAWPMLPDSKVLKQRGLMLSVLEQCYGVPSVSHVFACRSIFDRVVSAVSMNKWRIVSTQKWHHRFSWRCDEQPELHDRWIRHGFEKNPDDLLRPLFVCLHPVATGVCLASHVNYGVVDHATDCAALFSCSRGRP
jgi:hypothetical protein